MAEKEMTQRNIEEFSRLQDYTVKYETKIYKRLGAMIGSIIGVLLMIIAVCLHRTALGAVLLIVCAGMGTIIGNIAENKKAKK